MPYSNVYSTMAVDGSEFGHTPHRPRSLHENKALASTRTERFVNNTTHSTVYAFSSTNNHHGSQGHVDTHAVIQAYQQHAAEKILAFDQAFTRNDNNTSGGDGRHT